MAGWSEPNARWHDDFRNRTLPAALREGPAHLRVERGGTGHDLVLVPQRACVREIRLVHADLAEGRRQPVWIAGDTMFVEREFAGTHGDDRVQQFMALALARHVSSDRNWRAAIERALQGPDVIGFALGLDAMDELAGRGPQHTPPRQRRPSQTEVRLAALLLLQARDTPEDS
ncbi:MAG: hypothetical protein ACQRW7_04325 [Caulobacterales bacterium]|uniref:hypothetical protein n=1 Tax=Glycocaulis sp. TaxID=1969725 RepID=UPI003F9ED5DB